MSLSPTQIAELRVEFELPLKVHHDYLKRLPKFPDEYKNNEAESEWQGYLRHAEQSHAEVEALKLDIAKALQALTQAKSEIAELQAKYDELIYCVSHKFKDESRHQTAKRYLLSWEGRGEQKSTEAPKTELLKE